MARQKIKRKDLLKSPDEFLTLTERALNFVRDRARYFHFAGIAVAAVALVYIGVTTYLNYVDQKAQDAYFTAYSEVREEKAELEKAEELFKKVAKEYRFSSVSKLVAPQIGYLKYGEKKYDEALAFYKTFVNQFSEGSPYHSLATLALAAVHEQKGEPDKGIDLLRDLSSIPGNVFMEQTLLSLGRLYQLTDQHEKAREIYKDFTGRFATSPFMAQVKAYLNQPS
ncbi:MAG: tetratricopeptide repeat protein [Deltaproteobacteria bacterium]|nr:tetratricopeptide repeat protein [Deltaproteobacteria bacterium]